MNRRFTVVDGLNADLIGSILHIDLVVGHVGAHPVIQQVGGLNSDVADNTGHL